MLFLNIIIIVGMILTLISIITLVRAIISLKPLQMCNSILASSIFFVVTGLFVLISINLKTYFTFTAEQNIANISFKQISKQYFQATLTYHNKKKQEFDLYGDQWILSSEVLVWKPIAQYAGFSTLYRLDRISGRYNSIQQELNAPRSVYALNKNDKLNIWQLATTYSNWSKYLVEAQYGNAVFMPMRNDISYKIKLTRYGLIATENHINLRL